MRYSISTSSPTSTDATTPVTDFRQSAFEPAYRIGAQFVFVGHALLAWIAWWLLPGGFPFLHSRFWSNQVLVLILAILASYGCWLVVGLKRRESGILMVWFTLFWLVASISLRMAFPVGLQWIWLLGILVGIAQGALAWKLLDEKPAAILKENRAFWIRGGGMAVSAAIVGVYLPVSQIPDVPSTRPYQPRQTASVPARQTSSWAKKALLIGDIRRSNRAPAEPLENEIAISRTAPDRLAISDQVIVWPKMASVQIECEPLTLMVKPLLTFEDSSPDGCWTALSPSTDGNSAAATFDGYQATEKRIIVLYKPSATLDVRAERTGRIAEIVAHTTIRQPVYSHLNTFCEVTVTGHHGLSCTFSPCSDQPIDVLPAGYPSGDPARLACLFAGGRFDVVQARSGEKGPYRTLASGRLSTIDALSITFTVQKRDVCRLVFEDWVSQASTAISPTAGWGLPVNAIEFHQLSDSPDAPAAFYLSLAATSVGRGLDTVGHVAGTYRNRIRIEPVVE